MKKLLVGIVFFLATGYGTNVAQAAEARVAGIRITSATAEEIAAVREAVGDYRSRDLPIANIRLITFQDTPYCNTHDVWGYEVTYTWSGTGDYAFAKIYICDAAPSWALEPVLVHEMSHAFTDEFTPRRARNRFLELRGLTSWYGGPYYFRGTEQAAEGMAEFLTGVDLGNDYGPNLTSRQFYVLVRSATS